MVCITQPFSVNFDWKPTLLVTGNFAGNDDTAERKAGNVGAEEDTLVVTMTLRKEKLARVMKNQRNLLRSSSWAMINLLMMPSDKYENVSAMPYKNKN